MNEKIYAVRQSTSRSIKLADMLFLGTLVMVVGLWILTRFFGVEGSLEPEMPTKVVAEAERELYLTPGGIYTMEDIEANDGLTSSQKFVGFMATHDFNPQLGDILCPVTRTKGNPECTWVIGGQEYQFCCPPCIDEFVMMAKDRPESIGPPEDYIK